jgi:hypothetical protein
MLGILACTEQALEVAEPDYTQLFSPTGVSASVDPVSLDSVVVSWKEVDRATGYQVELYDNAEFTGTPRTAETEALTVSYGGLDIGRTYAVRIRAIGNNVDPSNWAVINFETVPPPPPETIEWNFSDDEFADIPTTNDYKQTLTVRGLDVVGGTGGVGRTAVNVTMDDYIFTWRLDLRGGGTMNTDLAQANRVIHFKADKPCVVTVYANSATAGRTLKITDKNNVVLGEYGTTGTPGKVDVNVTEATDIYIYSAGSGIEVYLVKMVVGGSYEPDHTAILKSLTVIGETLSPAFDPEVTDYEVNVAKSVTAVTIDAGKNHVKQTIEGDGEHTLTGDVTEFPVRVTAEDGTTTKTYNITVNRAATASSDATLKSLKVSPGNLSPEFGPDVTEYTVTTTAEKVTVTAEANHKFSKVGNNGVFEADNLVEGVPHIVTIPVLAEDLTTKIYTVTVTREAPPSGGGATTRWWNFSDDAFKNAFLAGGASTLSFTQNYTVDGLEIIAGGSEMRYTTSSQSMDGYSFTHRLQLNGTGDITKRTLKFDVEGPSMITVYMITGSNGSDRPLVLHNGTEELGRLNTGTDGSNLTKETFSYTGGAGSIYIYSGNSGINLYGLKVETGSGGGGEPGGGDTPGDTWTKVDLGEKGNGNYSVSSGKMTVTGVGKWESGKQSLTFVYMQVSGAFTATVKVDSYDAYDTANNAGQAGLLVTPDITKTGNDFIHWLAGTQKGLAATVYSRRESVADAGRGNLTAGGTGSEVYLKIERNGDNVILYASKDGTTWGSASKRSFTGLADELYIGPAMNSRSDDYVGTAVFSNFTLNGQPVAFE